MHTRRTRPQRSRELGAMRKPIRVAFRPFSFRGALAEHIGEKCAWVDAMRGIVRTSVDAAWFFQVRAEIARSSLLLDGRLLAPGALGIVDHHFERMQVDVAVGTILRAEAAADAPILDDDFERIAPSNRADGAADHAERIAALPATGGDKILIEAQAIADEASDSVVRISASIHTGVAARAILQVQNQQALRLHQSLREKLIDGDVVNHLHALLICGEAFGGDGFQAFADARETFHHLAEIVARDANQLHVVESDAGGRAHAAVKQTDLAEEIAAGKVGEHHLSAEIILRDLHEADSNEIKTVSRFTLERDRLAGRESLQFHAFLQVLDEIRGKIGEHRDAAKMIFEGAAAIGVVQLRAEGFVLQHDVENVAQHFERDDLGLRGHGGGAGIEIHASHFAEEIAGTKFSDGVAVRKIDRRVDGNGSVPRFFLALVFFARDKRARKPLEKSFGAALRLDVSNRRGNRYFCLAFENVESGGAEFAFTADDLAFAIAPLDDGAAIELQKRSRDAFENGNLKKVLRLETLRPGACGDGRANDPFIGQRARWAGDHALAARNACGIAHRRIEIESDAGEIAFAHAAEHEIIFDFVAATDAAIAEDARVMVDGDGKGRIILTACNGAFGEALLRGSSCVRERLQFAVAGIQLARARRGMVRHHQFEKRLASAQDFLGIGDNLQARLDGTNAGCGENARASVHDAETANPDGRLILQMAERGDADAVHTRGVEDAGAGGHAGGLAVDGDIDKDGRCCSGRHIRDEFQRAGLRRRGRRE